MLFKKIVGEKKAERPLVMWGEKRGLNPQHPESQSIVSSKLIPKQVLLCCYKCCQNWYIDPNFNLILRLWLYHS